MFNSHHRLWYIPNKILKRELLKIKPLYYNITLSKKYFALINESSVGSQTNPTNPGRATNSPIEISFISQRLAILSFFKFNHMPSYKRWDKQQSHRSRHVTDTLHDVFKTLWQHFCVSASNVDVAVLLIAYPKLLSFKNVYFGTSAENTNIDSHL